MLGGKAHIGEDVVLGLVHKAGEFGELRPGLVGDPSPLRLGGLGAGLGEGGRHEGRDDAPAALAGVGERVAHGVDSAAPPGGVHQLGDGGLDALVGVGDDVPGLDPGIDAAQAAPRELAQELGPEEPAPAKAGVSASEGPMSMLSTRAGRPR